MSLLFKNLSTLIASNYSYKNFQRSKLVKKRVATAPKNWEFEISNRIQQGNPLLFGRLGGLEASCLGIYLDLQSGFRNPVRFGQGKIFERRRLFQLCTNAGVFPIDEDTVNFFAREHLKALESIDIFSVWGKSSAWVEANYLDRDKILFVSGDASYPWVEARDGVSEHGWGVALDGKKVLVVSPFVDSFREQSTKFDKIFARLAYPKIELEFIRAPLSQGGLSDGSSYTSHLTQMKDEISKKDFDVALVSAGGYSLPLASHAKQLGKIGIHAGGALQLFFGVTGQRYDTYRQVKENINDAWKRPFEHERPGNWRDIEEGCYW